MLPDARVDPLDPERSKVSLALLTPDVGVNATLPDLFLGSLVRALLRPPVSFSVFEDLPTLLAGVDAARHARHLAYPQKALDALLVRLVHFCLGVQPPLAPRAFLLQDVVVPAPAALKLAPPRDLEAPGNTLVGLHLRHLLSSSRFSLPISKKRLAARDSRFASLQPQLLYQRVALVAALAVSGALLPSGLASWSRVFPRSHDHDHVAPVEVRLALDAPQVLKIAGKPSKELLTQLRMLYLATAEHDRNLYFVAASQKTLDVPAFGGEVVVAYLRPELYLPHVDVDLLFAGGFASLLLLISILAVVQDPVNRGIRVGCYFHEVHV